MSGSSWSCHGPRAPGPARGVTSLIVLAEDHVRRGSPACIAPTGSGASPPPSACLGSPLHTRSVQGAVSPCWEADLPDVVAAPPARRAWTPPPAALEVPLPGTSPTTSAFPPCGPGRRSTQPGQRLPHGTLGAAAVIRFCAGPQVGAPPRALLPLRRTPYGRRGFSIRAAHGVFPPRASDRLTVRIGPWTVWGLSPHHMRSLVGCSPNARFQARGIAGARYERTLFPVACKPLLGSSSLRLLNSGDR